MRPCDESALRPQTSVGFTHPPSDCLDTDTADDLPDKRDNNMQEGNERPCDREVRARRGVWRCRRPLSLCAHAVDVVVLVDWLGVEPERGQDERQAQVEQQRVDAPENVQREGNQLRELVPAP